MQKLGASQSNWSVADRELPSQLNHDTRENVGGSKECDCDGLKSKTSARSEAAKFNLRVLKRLQEAYKRDPEVNLQLQLPKNYSDRLQSKTRDNEQNGDPPARSSRDSIAQRVPDQSVQRQLQDAHDKDIRSLLNPDDSVEVMYPLSSSIREIIASYQHTNEQNDLFESVVKMLTTSEIIHTGPVPTLRTVFKCSPNAVVKVICDAEDYTEYTMLQFLEEHAPSIPAPKPLGVLRIGQLSLIFASYLPGQQLTDVWSTLRVQEKVSLMTELERILRNLRSIGHRQNQPLGGIAGEGCKDLRRHVRRTWSPIYTVAEYDNFLFSKVRFGSETYIDLLRSLAPSGAGERCLSHGDLRPDNIIVQQDKEGFYTISGLIDWEFSGIYPSHYESVKATNCLGTNETSDWYSYLPPCISPSRQPQRWLLDYVIGWLLE